MNVTHHVGITAMAISIMYAEKASTNSGFIISSFSSLFWASPRLIYVLVHRLPGLTDDVP